MLIQKILYNDYIPVVVLEDVKFPIQISFLFTFNFYKTKECN